MELKRVKGICRHIALLSLLLCSLSVAAQSFNTLRVNGDVDKFYPVIFKDSNWGNHAATVLEIGRSDIHMDDTWRGSLVARFRFHTLLWGHSSNFVEADVYQYRHGGVVNPLIAAFHDATLSSGNFEFVIWLKGNTTYYYTSNAPQSPRVYDNVQHMLPYQQENAGTHTFRTTVDENLNSVGRTMNGSIYQIGSSSNYMAGNLGLGKLNPSEKLEVNGNIRAKEIKVEATNWPDYVFKPDYPLQPLTEVEQFIKNNGHLPEMPKAADAEADGVSLGEMDRLLLKKVEELTLYLIEKDKALKEQTKLIKDMKLRLDSLSKQ